MDDARAQRQSPQIALNDFGRGIEEPPSALVGLGELQMPGRAPCLQQPRNVRGTDSKAVEKPNRQIMHLAIRKARPHVKLEHQCLAEELGRQNRHTVLAMNRPRSRDKLIERSRTKLISVQNERLSKTLAPTQTALG